MKSKLICAALTLLLSGGSAAAYKTTESESLNVWFEPVTLVADGTTVSRLVVCENDTIDYSAFNMAFFVPKGIHIVKVKKGRDWVEDIEMSARASSTHSIACNMLSDGTTIKVIADSSMLDDLYPDDEDGNKLDELYSIGLIADPDMVNGTYTVQMLDVKFVLSNADACVPAEQPIYGTFTITGGQTTGIDEVGNDRSSDDGDYYDLLGRKVHGVPAAGIYLHNGEKVIVK
ncbi:hypothetical protein [uncultured Muribaculum sp.]|uniref:hypothetical protein n=1 Tax=uncultured Muribaculum sp. TaxID=1918613 RepID=UPI0025F2E084|nr:hypothetical protein [uncultured Muribaculum sp.]